MIFLSKGVTIALWASVGKLPSCKEMLTISVTADIWRSRYCFMSQVGWGSSEQEAFEVLPSTFWTWSWVICWNLARGLQLTGQLSTKLEVWSTFARFVSGSSRILEILFLKNWTNQAKVFLDCSAESLLVETPFLCLHLQFICIIPLFSFKNTCAHFIPGGFKIITVSFRLWMVPFSFRTMTFAPGRMDSFIIHWLTVLTVRVRVSDGACSSRQLVMVSLYQL